MSESREENVLLAQRVMSVVWLVNLWNDLARIGCFKNSVNGFLSDKQHKSKQSMSVLSEREKYLLVKHEN